ncbi:MAG: peptide-methionine (S)-S-oxide reductase MsrA [Opitutaceae bacterium]|nr:peptide-methionine (S)-S-oxide reductase MsrA [Opitutaceae bacterium]
MTTLSRADSVVLGGGCFWCLEASYRLLPGVTQVTSGYSGGHIDNPTYKQVCAGTTGHAEVVKVDFDPGQVSLEKVLDLFWVMHDPTQVDRQGNDVGPQYRSIILYANESQKKAAESSIAEAQKEWDTPIVTQLVPLQKFWPAEDYHQEYFKNNPTQGYCAAVVRPKVKKVEKYLKEKKD